MKHALHEQPEAQSQHGDRHARDAPRPEVVSVALRLADVAPVQVLREQCGAVHHEGGPRRHVGGQHARDHQAKAARKQQLPGRVAEGILRICERRLAALDQERGHDDPDKGPADRAESLDEVAVGHPDATGPLVAPCPDAGQNVRLGDDADQSVDRQHDDREDTHVPRRHHGEHALIQRFADPRESAGLTQADRDQQKAQRDDEHALHEVRVGRGDKPADKAVHEKGRGHRQHDRVRRDDLAGGDAHQLAGALEHGAHVEREIRQGEGRVHHAHPLAVAVLVDLSGGRAPEPPEQRGKDPIERRDEEVLPLVPDARVPGLVDLARQRHGHFRVRADAQCLADHEPDIEAAVPQEVVRSLAHPARGVQADSHHQGEVQPDHPPVNRLQARVHSEVAHSIHSRRSSRFVAASGP